MVDGCKFSPKRLSTDEIIALSVSAAGSENEELENDDDDHEKEALKLGLLEVVEGIFHVWLGDFEGIRAELI